MFAILIAAWVLFWPLIAHVSLQSHRRITHLKIKHSVESMLTEHFTVPVALIPNLKGLKEFDFQGNRYDLITAVKKDDVWHVSAVNDKKEKLLERALERQSDKDNDQGQSFWWHISIIGKCIDSNKVFFRVVEYPDWNSELSTGFCDKDFPPPDKIV